MKKKIRYFIEGIGSVIEIGGSQGVVLRHRQGHHLESTAEQALSHDCRNLAKDLGSALNKTVGHHVRAE